MITYRSWNEISTDIISIIKTLIQLILVSGGSFLSNRRQTGTISNREDLGFIERAIVSKAIS